MTFDSASIPGCKINMCFKYKDSKDVELSVSIGTVQRVRYEKRSQEESAASFGRSGTQTLKGIFQIKGSLTLIELQQSLIIDILIAFNFLRKVADKDSFEVNTIGGSAADTDGVWKVIDKSKINYSLLNTLLKGINLSLYYAEPDPSNYKATLLYQKEILNIIIDGESSAMGMDVLALQTEIPFTASYIKPFRKVV